MRRALVVAEPPGLAFAQQQAFEGLPPKTAGVVAAGMRSKNRLEKPPPPQVLRALFGE